MLLLLLCLLFVLFLVHSVVFITATESELGQLVTKLIKVRALG